MKAVGPQCRVIGQNRKRCTHTIKSGTEMCGMHLYTRPHKAYTLAPPDLHPKKRISK